jgi:chemotaxis signal transduction protein
MEKRVASFKGIKVNDSVSALLPHMPLIDEYRESLQSLQAVWDNLSLLGQLSGTTAGTEQTREAFAGLTGELLNNLAEQTLAKLEQKMRSKSQVVIDILTRNLYERTADIGFLTTDDTIRHFAAEPGDMRPLQARFREYVKKYSVYEDVVLLNTEGHVLARLLPTTHEGPIADAWIRTALETNAPYVEAYGDSELFPGRGKSLIYAYRVNSGRGNVLGVLGLCFRFDDEMTRIFGGLSDPDEAIVLGLLDAEGKVIASSDPWQIPLRAQFVLPQKNIQRIRFAGRVYLAIACDAQGYQGYMGPGWRGFAMIPIDQAFSSLDGEASATIEPALLEAVISGGRAFSAALQEIPHKAQSILRDLDRSVWNGTVRHGNGSNATNPAFSKILLREISRVGSRMGAVFDRSIGNLQTTVISSLLADCHSFAALAIDIMDRNLYERANDCRWWALDPVLLRLTETPPGEPRRQGLEKILAYINGLYTVYSNLLLFDGSGTVIAVSNPQYGQLVGQSVAESWVDATAGLSNSQGYVVSDFVKTELYGDRHTYIYAAALLSPKDCRKLGGIGIVFDSEPQFCAMLKDILPRDVSGAPLLDSHAVFVDGDSTVIATSDARYTVGEQIKVPHELLNPPAQGCSGLFTIAGQVMAVGSKRSVGYREYKGPDDLYKNEVVALVFMPLAAVGAQSKAARSRGTLTYGKDATHSEAKTVEIASFHLGEYWLGLPSVEIIEAIELTNAVRLANTPKEIYGAQIFQNASLPLYNLHAALGLPEIDPSKSSCQVIVVRGQDGSNFGVLVDELGDVVETAVENIDDITSVHLGAAPVLASVVRDPTMGDAQMLILLSAENMLHRLSTSVAEES